MAHGKVTCTLVNRAIPCPGDNIVPESASDLALALAKRGVHVHIVTLFRHASRQRSQCNNGIDFHVLPAVYNGKNSVLRFCSSLIEGRRLARYAFALNEGPVIAQTNPPLLNFWIARTARCLKRHWLYWTLDIYPEAFLAAGLTSKKSLIYRFFKKGTLASCPDHMIVLGPEQSSFIESNYASPPSVTVLPCGVMPLAESSGPPDWNPGKGYVIFGYVGNLGEAHSAYFLQKFVDMIDPQKHRLVLSVTGKKAKKVIEQAKHVRGIIILDRVPQEKMRFIDIHLVSLLPAWNNICVPSKSFSAVCQGAAILYYGSHNTDVWKLLKDVGWCLEPSDNLEHSLRNFFEELSDEELTQKKVEALRLAKDLLIEKENAHEAIYNKVIELQTS